MQYMGSTYKISKISKKMNSKSVGFTPTRIFIDHLTAKFHVKQNELKILNGLFSKFFFLRTIGSLVSLFFKHTGDPFPYIIWFPSFVFCPLEFCHVLVFFH